MNQRVKYKKSRQRDNVSEFPHDSQEGKDFLSVKTITEIIKGGLTDFDYSRSSSNQPPPNPVTDCPIPQSLCRNLPNAHSMLTAVLTVYCVVHMPMSPTN